MLAMKNCKGVIAMLDNEVNAWINRSNSNKAFIVRVEDTFYVGALSVLKKFLNRQVQAVKLAEIVPDRKE
jgi:hypothetical protein